MAYPVDATGDALVTLELLIGIAGNVEEATVVDGTPPFAAAAQAATAGLLFEPATRDGQPVRARIRLQIHFTEPLPPTSALSASPEEPAATNPLVGQGKQALPAASADTSTSVTVSASRPEVERSLSRAEVRQLPGAFGDPFRAVEAMPGVTPIVTGLPYFFVRGAPPGNVGYLFDGIRVPALYHVGAGPSVIHPAFVEGVTLYPGALPARYGRYTGGIVTADGAAPEQRFRGELSARVVDSGAMVEAPFANGRGNLMLAGRYSYAGPIIRLVVPGFVLNYWDYQARVSFAVTPKDRVSVFAFGAYDYAADPKDDGTHKTLFDSRFHRLDVRYDRRVSDTGTVRVAATFGTDRSSGQDDLFVTENHLTGARLEYADELTSRVRLRAGADVNVDSYRFTPTPDSLQGEAKLPELSTHQDVSYGARADLPTDLGRGVTVTPGLRVDMYSSGGRTVPAIEPRASCRYQATTKVAILSDFGIAHQMPSYIVAVPGFQPNLDAGLQASVQGSAGVEVKLPWEITASLIGFENALFNATDRLGVSRLNTRPNPTPGLPPDGTGSTSLEHQVGLDGPDVRSKAHTVGLELFVHRRLTERLGGFVSYTLARSERSAMSVQGPSAYDRTHVLSGALAYDLGRGFRAGARATFYTGVPARVAYDEAARRPPRTEPFYRLDWRFEKRWLIGGSGAWWAIVAEVLNTTLNKEVVAMSCAAYRCREEKIGPVTVPSLGLEAAF